MKTPFYFALAIAASISTAAFMTPTFAQAPQQQQQMQGQADEEKDASPSDRAAFLNARIAALKAVLALTTDQEKLWAPVETAIRDAAKNRRNASTSCILGRSQPTSLNCSTPLPIKKSRAPRH